MSPQIDPLTLFPAVARAARHGARRRRNPGRPALAFPASQPGRSNWLGEFPPDPEADRRLPVDSPERRRLPMLLRRAWYGLNQAFRHLAAQTGITPDQFTVLRTLHEHARFQLTQSDLAEKMSSDPNTIASLVGRMGQQGLIERRTNAADRRAHSLALRPAGQRKYHQVRRRAVALQTSVLAALPEPNRELFLAQLELIGNACRQAAEIGRVSRVPRARARRNAQPGRRRETPRPS